MMSSTIHHDVIHGIEDCSAKAPRYFEEVSSSDRPVLTNSLLREAFFAV